MDALILKRDVTRNECDWLDRDYRKGEIVWRFTGCTYGCISPTGRAVRAKPRKDEPFFELPIDSVDVLEGCPV